MGLTLLSIWAVLSAIALAYLVWHQLWRGPRFVAQHQHKTIEALALAINAKDNLTFDHVRRVQIYARGLGLLAKCTKLELDALHEGALLHDVGKIGVPDSVLTKRGQLTADEFELMKIHPVLGAQILERVDFRFPIVPVVRYHHERWDGSGYPDGLRGADIPLTARVLSIVDCFDAVREDRPYRKGMTRQESIDLLISGSGTFYDPTLVGLFLVHLPIFELQIRAERAYLPADFGVESTPPLNASARLAKPAAGLQP